MKKAFLRLLAFVALLSPAASMAQTRSKAIQFVPPGGAQEGRTVTIAATFNSPVRPVAALLFVRPIGQSSFIPLPLQINGNQLLGQIPPSLVTPPGVEYFLSVTDEENVQVTFPPTTPEANPVRLVIAQRATWLFLRAVSPSSGTVISDARPPLHLEQNGGGGGLDATGLRVFVDRREISDSCRVEAMDIFCSLPWDLALGTHTITAAGRGRNGQWAQPLEFVFTRSLQPPKAEPGGGFHGRALVEADWYRLERAPSNATFLPYPVRGNRVYPYLELDATGKAKSEDVAIKIEQTSLDRLEQPGPGTYSLDFKGLSHEIELGDSARAWTDLSLSPLRVRGLRARGWKGTWISGEALAAITHRAIEDPDFNTAVYAQYAYGGRLTLTPAAPLTITGYALETRDDPASVTINTFAIPVANRLAGGEASVALGAGLKAVGEIAFNRYVSDLNANQASHGRGLQFKLTQNRPSGSWTASYRQTTPAFVSLGNYLVQSDYRGFDANGTLLALANKVVLSANGQIYRDNTEGQKTSTFRLKRYQFNVSAQTFARGPQLLGGVGQQRQRTDSLESPLFENKLLNWSAGFSQGFGPFRLGSQLNVTENRTVIGTAFLRDFDSRSYSVNASWFGRLGSLQFNGDQTISRDLSSGARTRNISGTVRATTRINNVAAEGALTEARGRDTPSTTSTRQSTWLSSLTWEFAPKRFWRLRAERLSYSDFLHPLLTYQESRFSLAYGLEF